MAKLTMDSLFASIPPAKQIREQIDVRKKEISKLRALLKVAGEIGKSGSTKKASR